MLFDNHIIVDWSAANVPKTGRDSIWICRHGEPPVNPATRAAAKLYLESLLAEVAQTGQRAVLGFDFPFGYPVGFATRLGLSGGEPWRATWELISGLVEDDPDNRNNRFEVGAQLNRIVSGKQFPFWGCPPRKSFEFLGPRHHRGHTASEPLQEHRLIDRWMTGAQPCWKLAYTGSVGSQMLTGIPIVWALRNDERWRDRAAMWPFEVGLRPPRDAAIVFAEVWPSWWNWKDTREPAEIADRAQVRHVAAIFAERDRAGDLASWFAPPLPAERLDDVLHEEAWTLGVVAPRQRARKAAA